MATDPTPKPAQWTDHQEAAYQALIGPDATTPVRQTVIPHDLIRAVSGNQTSGWTVAYTCLQCGWASSATAPTVEQAHLAQRADTARHQAGAKPPAPGALRSSAHESQPGAVAPGSRAIGRGFGWLPVVAGVLLLLALLGSCFGDSSSSSTYSDEDCAALSLSAASGDVDSAAEYANHCE